ncbi:MAG: hypothetical protein ACT4PJ_13200 [Gemmatimonadaceae bacterium]
MVSLTSILIPTLLSAVLVFFASFLTHMVLRYHWNDVTGVPDEDAVMESLRRFNIPPGDHMVPRAESPKASKEPAFMEKLKRGPVIVMTVLPTGMFNMGKTLAQWFVLVLVVSFFAGYVASRTLPPGADYLAVFRVVGTVAFIGFAGGLWQDSVWWSRKWSTTLKNTFDSLVYALLAAGVFGWLWPA